MSEKKQSRPNEEDAELERRIRAERKFSLAEAIGRMGGNDLLKGESPVTRKRQAELALEQYLEKYLIDSEGALQVVLLRRVRDGESLLQRKYKQPLMAMAEFIERILASESRLKFFVREVDAEWGRMHRELPRFQRDGEPPDPEDPYTFSSVRKTLHGLLRQLGDS